ncbi:hypothetical protein [Streptomyces sp. NPDC048191]|uniref:hypothetical protein n=1 Tax=Streptomyces sp. NPDC048191 TaxID=3155484 RepID=UPI0033CF7000
MTAETSNTPRPGPPQPPDPPAVTPELGRAAQELARLARQSPSEAGRKVLGRVAADAAQGGRALVGLDLVRVYPPHLLVPDAPLPRQQTVGWLAVVRDVLVFAPILLTWLSLGSALVKYDGDANFLQLWAGDYGTAAVVGVVVLIGLVIAITLGLHVLRLQGGRTASRAQVRSAVGEQLALITLELSVSSSRQAAGVPSGQLIRAATEITGATDRLTRTLADTTKRLSKIFDPGPETGFTKALRGWTASADALKKMGESLTVPHQLIKDFAQMREALRKDEEATRRSLTGLLEELNEATETSRVSDQAHVRVAEVVLEGTRQVREAMERFVERTQLLDMYMEAMMRTLDRLDQSWADAPPAGPTAGPAEFYDPMRDDGFARLLGDDDSGRPPSADRDRSPAQEPGRAPGQPPAGGPLFGADDDPRPDAGDDGPDTDDWYGDGERR